MNGAARLSLERQGISAARARGAGESGAADAKLRLKTREGTTTSASTVQKGILQALCKRAAPALGLAAGVFVADEQRRADFFEKLLKRVGGRAANDEAEAALGRVFCNVAQALLQEVVVAQVGVGVVGNDAEEDGDGQAEKIGGFDGDVERRVVRDADCPLHPVDDARASLRGGLGRRTRTRGFVARRARSSGRTDFSGAEGISWIAIIRRGTEARSEHTWIGKLRRLEYPHHSRSGDLRYKETGGASGWRAALAERRVLAAEGCPLPAPPGAAEVVGRVMLIRPRKMKTPETTVSLVSLRAVLHVHEEQHHQHHLDDRDGEGDDGVEDAEVEVERRRRWFR